ncbi:MAG: hypothetical protein IKP66_09415 [Lachnospiraceae bacterium]|nr:hypothetical protein [Lachnospiraceae bacterium]
MLYQTYKNFTENVFDRTKAIENAKKAKCNIITQDTIVNVPKINDYTADMNWVNDLISGTCKIVLNESRIREDDFTYGEVGSAVVIIDGNIHNRIIHGPVLGEYYKVKLINGAMVKQLRTRYNKVMGAIVCIHNHPTNSTFSFNDIKNLLNYMEIGAIVVVGNTSWLYVLAKTSVNYSAYLKLVSKMNMHLIELMDKGMTKKDASLEIVKTILNMPAKYGLYYKQYRRCGNVKA